MSVMKVGPSSDFRRLVLLIRVSFRYTKSKISGCSDRHSNRMPSKLLKVLSSLSNPRSVSSSTAPTSIVRSRVAISNRTRWATLASTLMLSWVSNNYAPKIKSTFILQWDPYDRGVQLISCQLHQCFRLTLRLSLIGLPCHPQNLWLTAHPIPASTIGLQFVLHYPLVEWFADDRHQHIQRIDPLLSGITPTQEDQKSAKKVAGFHG